MGCAEGGGWAEKREEKVARQQFPETENVRRKYRQRCRYIFNGWAIKRAPNVTKLDRRSVYTIIRSHAKLHPIPRTFLCHL